LYCVLKKARQKAGPKRRQKGGNKGSKKVARKAAKELAKKHTKKAHCHIQNIHANHQKKNFLKHILNLSFCCLETGLKPVFLLIYLV